GGFRRLGGVLPDGVGDAAGVGTALPFLELVSELDHSEAGTEPFALQPVGADELFRGPSFRVQSRDQLWCWFPGEERLRGRGVLPTLFGGDAVLPVRGEAGVLAELLSRPIPAGLFATALLVRVPPLLLILENLLAVPVVVAARGFPVCFRVLVAALLLLCA